MLAAIATDSHAGMRGGDRNATESGVTTPPEWFVTYQEAGVRVGKGQDADRDMAIANARKQIAEEINVQVYSETSRRISEARGGWGLGPKVTQEGGSITETVSAAVLEDSVIAREQRVGDTWFVVVIYDDGSMPQRIFRRTRNEPCPETSRDDFLQYSALATEIRSLGGCTKALQLARRKGDWVIVSGDQTFKFRTDDLFERLIFPAGAVSRPELSVRALPSEITDGGTFQLQVQSSENGYVTLYNVYGNGLVTEVTGNLPVQGGTTRLFPDENYGRELVGVLDNRSVITAELYVAVFSREPFMNEGHQLTSGRIENSASAASLEQLLSQLRGTTFAVATLKIRPKQ